MPFTSFKGSPTFFWLRMSAFLTILTEFSDSIGSSVRVIINIIEAYQCRRWPKNVPSFWCDKVKEICEFIKDCIDVFTALMSTEDALNDSNVIFHWLEEILDQRETG